MNIEYFTSSNSVCSDSFDSCKHRQVLSEEYKNADCDNESLMDFTTETSMKASSSSIQESFANLSNSHSTPEDNFSENALSSPISKPNAADCDKEIDMSSKLITKKLNGLQNSMTNSSKTTSIDDTIESVLSKIREENEVGYINSSNLVLPFVDSSTNDSYKSERNNSSHFSNISIRYNNLESSKRNLGGISYHITSSENTRNESELISNKLTVSNISKSHSEPYNYGNYYNIPNNLNNQIKLSNYNRSTICKDSDKVNLLYNQYQCQNMSYMPYITKSYNNQPYLPQETRAITLQSNCQSLLKPLKQELNYHAINETNQTVYGVNFKAPQSNACGVFDQSIRKRRPTVDQNKVIPTKKRKLINQMTLTNNYEDLVNKLKSTNNNALLMSPSISDSKCLLPPLEFVELKSSTYISRKFIHYQKYKSSTYSIIKPKHFKDCHQVDNFLSNYVAETISGIVLLSDKHNDSLENISDIVCASPSDSCLLSDNILHKLEPPDFICEPISPRFSTSGTSLVNCDSYQPVSSIKKYTQLSGSFLKRTKINGKSFSSVHIEETVSVASLAASRSQNSCQNCHMFLTGLSCVKRPSSIQPNDEYLYCSVCSCGDSGTMSPINDSESTKINIKTTPYKVTKHYKKVVDYDHIVRQRIPGNGDMRRPSLGVHFNYYSDLKLVQMYNGINVKEEVNGLLKQYSCMYRSDSLFDKRCCVLCQRVGDDADDLCGRLINLDCDNWVHLNCGLWCFDVFETVSGSLVGVQSSVTKALKTECSLCHSFGAGIQCYRSKCNAVYHVSCAYRSGCVFYTDRGMYCPAHAVLNHPMHLTSLKVDRRVIVGRDESSLVAEVVLTDFGDVHSRIRVGTLTVHEVGQLMPEQLTSGRYNSSSTIYPIGYHATRIYWSTIKANVRCQYECHIDDCDGLLFRVMYRDSGHDQDTVITNRSCDGLWKSLLSKVKQIRHDNGLTRLFPDSLSGEQLYGLTEPHVIRIIESLPGVDMITGYAFKFGRMELISSMPFAVNPSGSARTEPKYRTYVRRIVDDPCKQNSCSVLKTKLSNHQQLFLCDLPLLAATSKVANSRIQQYKQLRYEWYNNVVLTRSKIQGLGLFAATDLEKSTMIIEYIGETIRNEVGNRREQLYLSRNNSIYMFRLSDDLIIDATVRGGLARYINHSCAPNCQAEFLSLDSLGGRIVISTKQRIERGEELTYDYKFDFEDDSSDKIPCLCGAINCRGWMN